MVVDDDNTIRDIEVYTLIKTGFEAKGFVDGISMLEALKNEKPEIIVLDIMLPGKDGVDVLKEIRRYLYEIIYNLCDNAIRYNEDVGKVTVTLKQEEGNTVLSVADTGIGIPVEHQTRIFERFYRVDKSHSKKTGGTGLGLSIVKHAVAYHGGKIKLESTVNVGTTITVCFDN